MPLYKVVLRPVSEKLELEEDFLDRIYLTYNSILKYGEVKTDGINIYGQLGKNNINDAGYFTNISGTKRVYCNISGSLNFTISIDSEGNTWSWGFNQYGQLGTNNITNYSTPIAVCGFHDFCKISSGQHQLLAINKQGKSWAWGYNYYGQLGANNTTNYSTPVAVCGNHAFNQISSGEYQFVGLDDNGKLWSWGKNNVGQLGTNNTTSYSTPVAVCGDHTFCKIGSGLNHTVGIDNLGKAWGWGHNTYGQLGDNSTTSKRTPVAVLGVHTFCEVSSGFYHSLAIDKNGKVWAWGSNAYGQLGESTVIDYISTPVSVHGNHTFCKIFSGESYSIGIDKNGKTWGWGYKKYIGIGFISNSPLMTYITNNFFDIYTSQEGGYYSIALDDSGKTWAWGYNEYGQLGTNNTTSYSTPVAVCGSHTFCKISVGGNYVVSIDNNGKSWGWGYNYYGQLGINNTTSYSTPVAVFGNHTFCQVSVGFFNSYCLDNNGKLWSWGNNDNGQLGTNDDLIYSTPVAVYGNHTFCQISGRFSHVLAIDVNNKTWTWGYNGTGQLGTNNTTNYSTPVAVYGGHTFCKISNGQSNSIGIDNNNKVWSWGYNYYGQLGTNNTTNYSTPVAVCGSHTFCKISNGQNYSIGIDNNEKAWSWGFNSSGILGIKTNANVSTPVLVETNTTFCKIDTGANSVSIDKQGKTWVWGNTNVYNAIDYSQKTPIEITDSTKKHRVYLYCNYEVKTISAGDKYTIILNNKGHAWGFGINNKAQIGTGYVDYAVLSSDEKLKMFNINKITTNYESSLCLDMNGNAWGWGNNNYGQLGKGSITEEPVSNPTLVIGNHNFCEISTGDFHTVAIDNQGKAWSWGWNSYGSLGNNNIAGYYSTPVSVYGNKTFCKISCGTWHTVAMDYNGKIWSWGYNNYGQLGVENTTNYSTPKSVCGDYTFCKISAGGYLSGGIDINNYVYMWGWGQYGQIGNEDYSNVCAPTTVHEYFDHKAIDIEIDKKGYNAFANNNDTSWGWGWNNYGQLGLETADKCVNALNEMYGDHKFCKISSGTNHSFGFDKNNNVWGWGAKIFLGIGLSYNTPIKILNNKTFKSIYGGSNFSIGIDKNDVTWSWGYNGLGSLGIGESLDVCKFTPFQVCGNHTFKKLSCGYLQSIAIDESNIAWSWGNNNYGQLGIGIASIALTPTAVYGNHTFCDVKINYQFTLGLDDQGKIWAWGRNNFGQLGINTATTSKNTPVDICGNHTFCKISIGYYQGDFSVAIDNHGMAWSWGRNNIGQLGKNNTTCYSTPVAVYGNHTFCEVFCGASNTTAIDYQGKSWSWGAGSAGQLGTNSTTSYSTPVAVYGNHTFCKIFVNGLNVLAIDNNNVSWSWGFDIYNQLGVNKISTLISTPIKICGNHTFCFVSASAYNSFAIDNHGQAWGWGNNDNNNASYNNLMFGSLGDDPIYTTPVNINFNYQRRV